MSPRKQTERLDLILVTPVQWVTELIRLIGIIGVTRLLSFSRNFSVDRAGLREAARGWVILFGLVAYHVKSLAQGQSENLSNSNTSDSQTIDSITSNNNTSISNCPSKIMTTITLTIRITPMKLITQITQSRNNQSGITNHNNIIMRV
jgi:hypothetical protein